LIRFHDVRPWLYLSRITSDCQICVNESSALADLGMPLTCFPAWTFAFVEIASRYPRGCESFIEPMGPYETARMRSCRCGMPRYTRCHRCLHHLPGHTVEFGIIDGLDVRTKPSLFSRRVSSLTWRQAIVAGEVRAHEK